MRFLSFFFMGFLLAACANHPVDDIPAADTGQVFRTRFGTIVNQKSVNVRTSPQTAITLGVLSAGMAGTLAAADHATFVGGAVAGGAAAALLHYLGETDNGIEYQIMLDNGTLVVIDQLQASSDPVFKAGETVIVQFGAQNNRVLPLPDGPAKVAAPRRIRMEGESKKARDQDKKLDVQVCSKAASGNSNRENCLNF
mgnify:CR=1 FL=1